MKCSEINELNDRQVKGSMSASRMKSQTKNKMKQ